MSQSICPICKELVEKSDSVYIGHRRWLHRACFDSTKPKGVTQKRAKRRKQSPKGSFERYGAYMTSYNGYRKPRGGTSGSIKVVSGGLCTPK